MEVQNPEIKDPKALDITPADEDLRVKPNTSSTLSRLQTASLTTMVMSLYQIGYGLVSPYSSSGVALFGFATLLVSLMIYKWARNKYGLDNEILDPTRPQNSSSGTSTVFVISLIGVFAGLFMLFNVGLNGELSSDLLSAMSSDPTLWSEHFGEYLLPEVQRSAARYHTIYAWILLFTVAYFTIVSLVTYKESQASEASDTTLVTVSSVLVLVFSLGLVMSASHALHMKNYPEIGHLLSVSNLHWQVFLGSLMTGLSFLTWFANYKKWRVGFVFVSFVLLFAVVVGALSTGKSLGNTRTIYNKYKHAEDTPSWITKMSITHQSELLAAGCPFKYLDMSLNNGFTSINWELNNSLDTENVQSLNVACSGVLAQLYSSDFYKATTYGALATLAGLLLLASLLHFWNNPLNIEDKNSERHLLALSIMLLAFSAFLFFNGVSPRKDIQIYPGDAFNLQFGNIYTSNPAMSHLTFTPNNPRYKDLRLEDLGIDKKVAQDIYDFFDLKKKYVILHPGTDPKNPVVVYSKAPNDKFYDQFVAEQTNTTHGVALVWMKVEQFDKILISIYLNPSAPAIIKEAYGNPAELEPYFANDPDFGYIYAQTPDDLILENVLQKNHHLFRVNSTNVTQTRYINVPKFNATSGFNDSYYLSLNTSLPKETVDDRIPRQFDNLRRQQTDKAVHTQFYKDKYWVGVSNQVPKYTKYLDFLKTLPKDEPKIILYNFQYENRHRAVALLWNLSLFKKDHRNLLTSFLKTFDDTAIPLLPIYTEKDLDLELILNVGAIPDPQVRINNNKIIEKEMKEYFDKH